MIFIRNDFTFLDSLLRPDAQIRTIAWIMGMSENPGIGFMVEGIKRFQNSFHTDYVYELGRAHGVSITTVQASIDLYNLSLDYLNHQDLSEEELSLLDKTKDMLSVESYRNVAVRNKYGFTPLQLAILGNRLEFASQMIEQGFSLIEKSNNGLTALYLIRGLHEIGVSDEGVRKISVTSLEYLDDVDIILSARGESLMDGLMNDEFFRDIVLTRSNDSLFRFFKKEADLFEPSKHPEVTHIAISHGEGFWSTGLWSWARLASKEHDNVMFHLVNLEMLEQGGDEFIKQFDGWMNPGGGDDYPKKLEFTIDDWETNIELIKTYQKALGKTFAFKIPSIGMCAGAQNFVLHHKGSLYPLKGYVGGNHQMVYLKGTLPHFMAMTKDQQKTALEKCEFPEIIFKGDTAHHYAAVTYKLGERIQLGAISEDGVAMSFAHKNGLSYATQFHPEHYYHKTNDSTTNHQKVWLDNFIDLANLHHDFRMGIREHPEVFFEQINERLEQCMETPTCLMGDGSIFNNATIEAALFGN